MQLRHIAFESVKRHKGRFAFVLAAVVLGIGTIVALVALTRTMQTEVSDELDKFGANIVVMPKSDMLDLAYGGLTVGGLAVSGEALRPEDADKIHSIPNHHNVSVVAPKLVGVLTVGDARVVLIGTRFKQELGQQWWQISGDMPRDDGEVLVGADAAMALHVSAGSMLTMPYLTALANVMLPLAATRVSEREQREMARAALNDVGLNDKMMRLPRDLSGGEQQRVAIARAIVNRPPLVLADEPTGCLDSKTGREIINLFLDLKNRGLTIVMVTHDGSVAAAADRLITMEDGVLSASTN